MPVTVWIIVFRFALPLGNLAAPDDLLVVNSVDWAYRQEAACTAAAAELNRASPNSRFECRPFTVE